MSFAVNQIKPSLLKALYVIILPYLRSTRLQVYSPFSFEPPALLKAYELNSLV